MFNLFKRDSFEITDFAKRKAYDAFRMLNMYNPEKGWGCASAVLINRSTAITSAHNFNNAVVSQSKLFSPLTGKSLRIKSADIDSENDIAVIRLQEKATGSFPQIDKKTQLDKKLPIFKLRMTSFDPRSGRLELVRGRLKDSCSEIFQNSPSGLIQKPCSTFTMHSKSGDSGAGIFTLDGTLLTINNTGHPVKNESSGTRIDHIRRLSV